MNTKAKITKKCRDLEELLLRKNDAYGDSALNPLGVFSSCNASDTAGDSTLSYTGWEEQGSDT